MGQVQALTPETVLVLECCDSLFVFPARENVNLSSLWPLRDSYSNSLLLIRREAETVESVLQSRKER